jgi:hypothetical protein
MITASGCCGGEQSPTSVKNLSGGWIAAILFANAIGICCRLHLSYDLHPKFRPNFVGDTLRKPER